MEIQNQFSFGGVCNIAIILDNFNVRDWKTCRKLWSCTHFGCYLKPMSYMLGCTEFCCGVSFLDEKKAPVCLKKPN